MIPVRGFRAPNIHVSMGRQKAAHQLVIQRRIFPEQMSWVSVSLVLISQATQTAIAFHSQKNPCCQLFLCIWPMPSQGLFATEPSHVKYDFDRRLFFQNKAKVIEPFRLLRNSCKYCTSVHSWHYFVSLCLPIEAPLLKSQLLYQIIDWIPPAVASLNDLVVLTV